MRARSAWPDDRKSPRQAAPVRVIAEYISGRQSSSAARSRHHCPSWKGRLCELKREIREVRIRNELSAKAAAHMAGTLRAGEKHEFINANRQLLEYEE